MIDLSSLWAGPLCARLLQQLGATVIKVESTQRPDGARAGPAAFFDRFNAGKRMVALDFTSAGGRARLRALLERADIVIEASRPRALRQLGIDAAGLAQERPGLTWISLTGHGRAEPHGHRLAYGDDAGAAAGLSQAMFLATGEWLYAGDAIADPLTGIHAALAAWAAHRRGGGVLRALALVDVARHCASFEAPTDARDLQARHAQWRDAIAGDRPSGRQDPGVGLKAELPAAPLGADTVAVLGELGVPC